MTAIVLGHMKGRKTFAFVLAVVAIMATGVAGAVLPALQVTVVVGGVVTALTVFVGGHVADQKLNGPGAGIGIGAG